MRERLVHRDPRVAEPADALLVAERLAQRLAQHDRGVLDGVVALDLDVALGAHGQVEAGVAAERGQHVVVERHAGVDVDDAGAVEVEFNDDGGFLGLAFDFRATVFAHCAPISALALSSASFSSANPVVARRYPRMPTSRMRMPALR